MIYMKNANSSNKSKPTTISDCFYSLNVKLLDFFSSTQHSEDFKQTCSLIILVRLKFMCLLFSVSVPVSSIFDLLVLGENLALQILPLRLLLSVSLILVFLLCKSRFKDHLLHILLCSAFAIPTLFYLAVAFKLQTLGTTLPQSLAITPFLIITMLGLFPLTIRLGLFLFCFISSSILAFGFLFLNLSYTSLIHEFWQLTLFGGVATWLQLGQLSMLMKLYRESTVDPLTGLINRRVLMRRLEHICEQSVTTNHPCCLMILDLDKFKRINDEFGHQSGDNVLVALSNILNSHCNNTNIAARFGGEEFVFLMTNTPIEYAIRKAEEISSSIRETKIQTENGQIITITTSIGISQLTGLMTPQHLINKADELLYTAKLEGRDCIRY